ncbi:MAG: hypothetical protein BWX86_02905 [Verrucomicrobia bacterium ADurb.Bin122]|nr:MAG: hypothetical protein BWX86_02905 [Verrucomicrobia bacterium ADurb.Bin122]
MISSRNGSTADITGRCDIHWALVPNSALAASAPLVSILRSQRRTAQAPTAKNSSEKPPISATGARLRSIAPSVGIWKSQQAVATSVSTSTAASAMSEPVSTASTMASTSISSTTGQTRKETSGICTMGYNTSASATGGKKCPHQTGADAGRTRWRTSGKTVCKIANPSVAPSAQFRSAPPRSM